ncbi:MAG: S8 family serine peptidase [Anaerolineae bacterium]
MHRFKNIALPIFIASAVLTLIVITFYPAQIEAQAPQQNPITPELAEVISSTQDTPEQPIRFIITMHDQADLSADRLPSAELPKRTAMVRSLKAVAEASQSQILVDIEALHTQSHIQAYQPFWIFNGIAAEGNADAILTLAKNPNVAKIDINHQIKSIAPVEPISTTKALSLNSPATLTSSGTNPNTWGLDRIGAPQVWHGFGVTGTGVTVAIMDTGVDFEHPVLAGNYRGKLADGSYEHSGNWFHAAIPTQTVPIDLNGHGTHVAGIAVGQQGIGVAPGAEWIAVAISDNQGLLLDSYLFSGFEWLLAPNGDPALAPDLFNASWSNDNGAETKFEDALNLLKAAGVIPVFAAGNAGPITGTIGAPASYANMISIASADEDGAVSWFSSRGASPLHPGVAPIIAAPGGNVYSSLPGNEYNYLSGTSMATPHTVGALALLLSVNKSIKQTNSLISVLSQSAEKFEASHPNISSGYGLLDAVNMIDNYMVGTGKLSGVVQSSGLPLANMPMTITAATGSFQIETDSNGQYSVQLMPGVFSIEIEEFGYSAYTSGNVLVSNGPTPLNISLQRLPFGTLSGKITDAQSGPLAAEILIEIGEDETLSIKSSANGNYSLELPIGDYPITIIKSGYKIGSDTLSISAGQTTTKDFTLASTESILLIDAGYWNFRSREASYAEAFTELGVGWDTYPLTSPVLALPTAETLAAYDVVVWSDPRYSPGYVSASTLISDYLGTGGNILIEGSQIAIFDYQDFFEYDWMGKLAYASPLAILTFPDSLVGREKTEFAGFTADLKEQDPASDLVQVTTMLPRVPAKSEIVLSHSTVHNDRNGVGIKAGHCEDYNLIYFGFGVSDVQGVDKQAELLQESLNWFTHPQQETGVKWLTLDSDRPVVPGESYRYDLSLSNRSETLTTTYKISAESGWQTDILTQTVTLGPCQAAESVITITVPAPLGQNVTNQTLITVEHDQDSSINDTFTITHKTPASLLLVDDHRWFDQLEDYTSILDATGIDYDVWTTGGDFQRGSPSEALLKLYPYVVWYTAYDWFAPVTEKEVERLEAYLESGGRLFLSSQDFMYYNAESDLARNYFGIADYAESITPTIAYGDALFEVPAAITGSVPITYEQFGNNGDSLILDERSSAVPLLWHERGVGGVGNQNDTGTGEAWRAVFWSIPFDQLDPTSRPDILANSLGWLGDLGDSEITVDTPYTQPSISQTFTITLHNRKSGVSQTALLTNSLPAGLVYVADTLTGGATWDMASQSVRWNGELKPGETKTFTYAAIQQSAGIQQNVITVSADNEPFTFQRGVRTQAGGADLNTSTVSAEVGPITITPIGAGIITKKSRVVTYTVVLNNSGIASATNVTATAFIPDEMHYLTDTVQAISGSAFYTNTTIMWHGDLPPAEPITVTAQFTTSRTYLNDWILSAMTITQEENDAAVQHWYIYNPQLQAARTAWLPILAKN